jgi:hypothetical protein
MKTTEPKDDQNQRYAATIVTFVVLLIISAYVLVRFKGSIPETVAPYDFVLLALACFRLIRLFTYDQIMRVWRDMFLDKSESVGEDGVAVVVRSKPAYGFKRSLSDLFGCPWCMGMWISFVMTFLYFIFPVFHYVVIILALAGVASSIQITMNMVGAKAEFFKRENNLHN